MKAAPFVARWRISPEVGGSFVGRMALDDPAVFAGHYPGAPIFPGTFLVEALFQAAQTIIADEIRLEQIVACRFRSPLLPRDEIAAHFVAKDAGAKRTLIDVTAQGRAPAAELTMLVASVHAASPDSFVRPTSETDARAVRTLDAAFIEGVLPHRPPALLVERALVLDQPAMRPELRAHKTITPAEPCFLGTDSSAGSYPRCLVVESFCQSCGLLRAATAPSADHRDESKVPVVAKLANLRFFDDAMVGERLEHHVHLAARTPDGAVFNGQTVVSGRVIMQAERVVAAMAPITHQNRT